MSSPSYPSACAPGPKPGPVLAPGEFIFAATHLDHGHICNQTQCLLEAGATAVTSGLFHLTQIP